MKALLGRMLLLAILTLPMLVACGAPNSGAKDVLSPDQVRAHKAHKDKVEGGA